MTVRAETQTTSLGRYHVVKRLANGGMADVLLARTDGIEGFERHVVIKRIHAALLDEPRYVKMFLDEARLAASLHHHNIVQVNDIGQQAGEYFFAMEYVHGEDARGLLVNASERHQQIPLEHVITIISGAASGLHHAHEQQAADRTPLGIVHRDVSPANLLVGFDGSVKVADFGIALAAHRAEQTQSGVLKGKVAYMSPEQCNCERVDRRSDVFSLGICLYELATVHPCFSADNDFMTMSAIVNGTFTPPSQLSAAIDPALEAIILKALANKAKDRYQSADELRQALEAYATTANLRISSTGLADYMKQQFGTRALPWQVDDAVAAAIDDDLEPEIVLSPVEDSQTIVVDDEILGELHGRNRTTASPGSAGARSEANAERRMIKQTLPLRPVKPSPQMLAAAAVPEPVVPAPTEAVRPLPAPAAVVALATPTARAGRLWLGAAMIAFVAAAAALWFVQSAEAPVAAAPQRSFVTPLPAPRFSAPIATPAVETAVIDNPPAPAPKASKPPTRRGKTKATEATKPAPKWNPEALFPK